MRVTDTPSSVNAYCTANVNPNSNAKICQMDMDTAAPRTGPCGMRVTDTPSSVNAYCTASVNADAGPDGNIHAGAYAGGRTNTRSRP
jgi:hypothetical protein